VHAVVLRPPRRDDHDRRADPFRPGRLDQLPPVELREHEVENADIRVLEAEAGEPELAAAHDDRVEPGSGQVPGHAVCDDAVVLDDQDPGHGANDRSVTAWLRCDTGVRMVTIW